MTPKQFEEMLETMRVLFRLRKSFKTDMDFGIAIQSAIFSVNEHQFVTEDMFIEAFKQIHGKTEGEHN